MGTELMKDRLGWTQRCETRRFSQRQLSSQTIYRRGYDVVRLFEGGGDRSARNIHPKPARDRAYYFRDQSIPVVIARDSLASGTLIEGVFRGGQGTLNGMGPLLTVSRHRDDVLEIFDGADG